MKDIKLYQDNLKKVLDVLELQLDIPVELTDGSYSSIDPNDLLKLVLGLCLKVNFSEQFTVPANILNLADTIESLIEELVACVEILDDYID